MARDLATALAHALTPVKTRKLKAGLLPKGTKSVKRASEPAQINAQATSSLSRKGGVYLGEIKVDVNLPSYGDPSPEYREGKRRAMLGLEHSVVREAIRAARGVQTITGQASQVETHMSLTRPIEYRYAAPQKAPDRDETWTREKHCTKVDVNLKLKRLRALRKQFEGVE